MIVICEECGKKYRIDISKIKGKEARFKCKACNHLIPVTKTETNNSQAQAAAMAAAQPSETNAEAEAAPTEDAPPQDSTPKDKPAASQPVVARKKKGIGLRAKMILLFLVVPLLLISASSILYLWQMNKLQNLLVSQSTDMITKQGESAIADKARAVASQTRLFLESNPQLTKQDFNYDMDFRRVAVQKVGVTGYTALYEIPSEDNVWRTWAHVDPKLVGNDMRSLRKTLGKDFAPFWKTFTGVKDGKESRGYYSFKDPSGRLQNKYMVSSPIEGYPYVVAATINVDEFTRATKVLETRAKKITTQTLYIIIGILGATLILCGLIVSLYGHQLTKRIRSLTDVADRISVGELEAEIDTGAGDEIGDLSEAVARMQDSIRLSIERLRRRR
jgi:predicted Zn finger-like uncharacterized protein